MYFDSHAHLGEDCFAQDFVHIVENMRTAGVSGMMEIGFDGPSSYHAVELANRYDWIWAAVGSHPDDAAQVDEARIEEYRALCEDPRVKAIGEIGLDYHYEDPPRDVQQRAFRMQMELAQKLSLPVVIHEREAHEDGLRIISDFPDVTGVFHCFSGSYEMAKELIRRGWYIGFTGVVTFKNARKAVEVAEKIPLDRILIETDCPYMAPEPFRGRRNDPSLVPFVAKKSRRFEESPQKKQLLQRKKMPRDCSGFERSALNAAAGRFRHLLKQMLPSLTARGAVRDNFVYLKVLRKFAASKRMDRNICTYRDSVCFSCKSGLPRAARCFFIHRKFRTLNTSGGRTSESSTSSGTKPPLRSTDTRGDLSSVQSAGSPTGSVSSASVPLPFCDCSITEPPCACTIACTTGRLKPAPRRGSSGTSGLA